jgi:hypothetical protein
VERASSVWERLVKQVRRVASWYGLPTRRQLAHSRRVVLNAIAGALRSTAALGA